MGFDVDAATISCFRCGKSYPKRKGYFHACHSALYKGVGYLPICKDCCNSLFTYYLSCCKDNKDPKADAVRQMCRKLDLYWNEQLFTSAEQKSTTRNLFVNYLARINSSSHIGKCYDDTLINERNLWYFAEAMPDIASEIDSATNEKSGNTTFENSGEEAGQLNEWDLTGIDKDVIAFWGDGYTRDWYRQLEQRRKYYMTNYPDSFSGEAASAGSDVLMRQLCNLEVSIARDAAVGKSIDKSVNSLNNLMGSLNLKPSQKKNEDEDSSINNTPLGVWLWKYEMKKPLPETEYENPIKKYVFTWLGHVVKMLGIKNGYTRMYDAEIERLRVEKPEYDDEDDETLIINAYDDEGGDDI